MSIRIAGVPAEIPIEHLSNTSLERYRYINLLRVNYVISKLLNLIGAREFVSYHLNFKIYFFLIAALLITYVGFSTTTQTSP
jgi:hypothetical protein